MRRSCALLVHPVLEYVLVQALLFLLWLLCCTCCGTLKMGVCLHVSTQAHLLPLTTPPSASTTALIPPPHTIVEIDACRTQCAMRGVRCVL